MDFINTYFCLDQILETLSQFMRSLEWKFGTLPEWIIVIIAVVQAYFFWRQLKFMRESLSDTKITAEAAKESAETAKNQTDVAKKSFETAHRPWISCGFPYDISINGPLEYCDNQIRLSLLFNLKNIGHSPAVSVSVWFKLLANIGAESNYVKIQKEMYEQQKNFHEARKNKFSEPFGNTIFPGQSIQLAVAAGASLPEIPEFLKDHISDLNTCPFHVKLVGLVIYAFTFEEGYHQTGFTLTLQRKMSKTENRSTQAFFIDEGNVPANNLLLINSPFNGLLPD